MEVGKLSKLRVELKELSGCGKLTPSFLLEILENKYSLGLRSAVKIESLELNGGSFLSITALNGEKPIGSLRTSIDSLVNDKNGHIAEKWLKVKTEEFQNFRIKIGASFNQTEQQVKEKPKPPKSVEEKIEKTENLQECPYLAKLITGHGVSSESLDSLWRSRNILKEDCIKLSMQRDPLVDSQVEEINLESLSADILLTLNGNQLKRVVKDLCEEVQSLEKISQALPELQNVFNKKVEQRKNLGLEGRKENKEIYEKFEKDQMILKDALFNRTQKKKELISKQEELKNAEIQRDKLKYELLVWQEQTLYSNLIHKSNEQKSELKEKLSQGKSSMGSHGEATYKEIQSFLKDSSEIKEKLKKSSDEYESVKSQNNKMKKKINDLQLAIHNSETLQSHLKLSADLLSSQIKSRDNLNQKIHSALDAIHKSNIDLQQKHFKTQEKHSKVSEQLSQTVNILQSSEKSLNKSQLAYYKRNLEYLSQRTNLSVFSDLNSLSADVSRLKHLYVDAKNAILPDLENGSVLLLAESERVLLQAEKLDHMIESVEKQEFKLEELQSAMGQVKKRQALHVAVKSDPVDVALAEYVNTKEIPVKFTRQDAGNYLFGSTKIFIKLENSRLIVKVKGGTTSIEEFLNIYMPVEISKSDSPKSQRNSSIGIRPGKGPSLNTSFVKT